MTEKALSKKYHVFLILHPTCSLLPVSGVCLHHRHDGHWCRPSPTQPCTVAKSFTSTGSTEHWAGACVVINMWLNEILPAVTSQLAMQVYGHLHLPLSGSPCCTALGRLCKPTPKPVTAHLPCAGPHSSWVTANFWASHVLHHGATRPATAVCTNSTKGECLHCVKEFWKHF